MSQMRRNRAVSTTLDESELYIFVRSSCISAAVSSDAMNVIRDELEVIGQQVASDIARVDRLVVAADDDPT